MTGMTAAKGDIIRTNALTIRVSLMCSSVYFLSCRLSYLVAPLLLPLLCSKYLDTDRIYTVYQTHARIPDPINRKQSVNEKDGFNEVATLVNSV